MRSPLLDLPGAVAGDGVDAPVAAHYGSFNAEQRTLESGAGFVDLSHRDVVRISGPDRLTWLHSLTTQHFLSLQPREWTSALVLSNDALLDFRPAADFNGTPTGGLQARLIDTSTDVSPAAASTATIPAMPVVGAEPVTFRFE